MAAVAVTVLADDQLSVRFREAVSRAPGGPEDFTKALAAALHSYVGAGCVRSALDVDAAAALVQGRCFHHAVLDRLHEPRDSLGAPPEVAAGIVEFLTG